MASIEEQLVGIGRDSSLAINLRKSGFRVHGVKDPSGLKDLVLGEVRERYGK